MYQRLIKEHLEEAQQVLYRFLEVQENLQSVEDGARLIAEAIKNGYKIMSCGNGGSHCDAMHFAEEMTGNFREVRPAMPAIAISDPSHISCVSNDFGFEAIFSRYVEGIGNKGDVLLAISCSGNSKNILKAAETARSKGMQVVSLTGHEGGQLRSISDVNINVAHSGYADRVQEVHIKIIHILIFLIEEMTK